MASFKKNEEGVSAVIGVILMVAITVILAAVIAAFVFQLGNQMPNGGHTVVASVTRISDSTIQVKTMSGDINLLTGVATEPTYSVQIAGSASNATLTDNAGVTSTTLFKANTTGSALYFAVPRNADITVIAHYTDGSTSTPYAGKIA